MNYLQQAHPFFSNKLLVISEAGVGLSFASLKVTRAWNAPRGPQAARGAYMFSRILVTPGAGSL